MKPLQTLLGVVMRRRVEPRADVAVVRGDVRAGIEPASGFHDLGANLFLDSGHE